MISAQTREHPAICRLKRLSWPLVFGLLVLAGLLIAGTGYRHGLPYIDFGDEMTIWSMGRAAFDPSWTMYQPQYPPGLLVVSATIQRAQIVLGDPFPNPAGTVAVMRLASVLASVVTLVLIMLLANRMAGHWAAVAAGLCWLSLPLANGQAKLATVDIWLCAWFMAALVTGVEGWYRRAARWIGLSLLLAILATLFKWQAAAALCLPGLALLTFWRTNRRRMIALMAGYLVVVAAFSYWVIFVYHALEGSVYLPGTKTAFPTPGVVLTNLSVQLGGVGSPFVFGLLPLLALLLSMISRYRFRMALWAFPTVILAFNFILSVNGAPVFTRHYLAAVPLLAVMAGIGLVLLARLMQQRRLPPLVRAAPVVIAAVLLVWSWGSQFLTIFAMNWDDSLPDRRVMFAEWARTTATDGPLLISDPMLAAAVQTLYGYRGRPIETPYNQGTTVYLREDHITPDLVAAKNIRYLIISPYFDVRRLELPLIRLSSSTLNSPDNQPRRGSEWVAYYVDAGDLSHVVAPTMPLARFGGEIALNGYAPSRTSACPGDSITTRFLWNAPKTPTRYYAIFMHLSSDRTGELSFPINGQQPVSNDRPTITWNDPGERLLGPAFTWTLPKDLAPGTYRLLLGLFEPVSGDHLLLPDGKPAYVLATLEVGDCMTV